jgi:hypothetical protein
MGKHGSGISKAEKEEIIRWSQDPEELITVFTHKETVMKKLKSGAISIKPVTIKGKVVAWTMKLKPGVFRPRYPSKPRVATEAQKEAGRKLHQKASSSPPSPVPAKDSPDTSAETTPDTTKA